MGTIRTRTNRKSAARRREHPRPAAAPRQRTGEDRVREAGGPQDTAHYRCSCGKSFDGDVSTTVACPSCGTAQAW
jgi:hypothetical protein